MRSLPFALRGIAVSLVLSSTLAACSHAPLDPDEIGAEDTGVWSVAVDATHVYWTTTDGRVKKQPKAGGPAVVLADQQDFPYTLAVDEENVYWGTNPYLWDFSDHPGAIMKVSKSGGAPVVLAVDEDQPSHIVVDETSVYWTSSGGVNRQDGAPHPIAPLKKMPKDGGTVTELFDGAFLFDFGINAKGLYVAASTSDSPDLGALGLVRVDKVSGAAAPLGAFDLDLEGIWADEDAVYFSGEDVGFVSLSTGETVKVAKGEKNLTTPICSDGESIYFNTWREVKKVSLQGGPVTTLSGGLRFYDMAVDDTTVYVAADDYENDIGIVRRLPK